MTTITMVLVTHRVELSTAYLVAEEATYITNGTDSGSELGKAMHKSMFEFGGHRIAGFHMLACGSWKLSNRNVHLRN
jgi:hypothetical protein